MAEAYCDQYYNEHSDEEKNMYLHLLRVYLRPPDGGGAGSSAGSSSSAGGGSGAAAAAGGAAAAAGAGAGGSGGVEQALVGPALSLLSRHYDRIDAAQALALLPNDTPIHELLPFFEAVLSRNRTLRRNNQVSELCVSWWQQGDRVLFVGWRSVSDLVFSGLLSPNTTPCNRW